VIDVQGDAPVNLGGHGHSTGRAELRALLTARAREVGVDVRFGEEPDPAALACYDVVVGADGVGSAVRATGDFGTTVTPGGNRYVWLGTSKVFDSFTFPFVGSAHGWLWAHAYGYTAGASTFVVETTAATHAALGLDTMPTAEALTLVGRLFADQLDGHPLHAPQGTGETLPWLRFRTVRNERWHDGNVALLGDAAHTTHFTIGSGTRLALEDSIALAAELGRHDTVAAALAAYGRRRTAEIAPLVQEARGSARWFEDVPRHIAHPAPDFARLLINRRRPIVRRLPGAYLGYGRLRRAAATAPAARPARAALHALRRRND
jgi:2-polyprenyl-6-methoxyphenol hydroxylase-like FAD-dependent oxidoreductase